MVGERSGTLDEVLKRIADLMETQLELRGKIRSALAYPFFILAFSSLLCWGLVTFLLPSFEPMWRGANLDLHKYPVTLFLMKISVIMRTPIDEVFLTLFLVAMAITFYRMTSSPEGQDALGAFLFKVPLLGTYLQISATAEASATMARLLESGMPIIEVLDLTAETASNSVVANSLRSAGVALREGGDLSTAFETMDVFPELFVQMVAVGESTGEMPGHASPCGELLQTPTRRLPEESHSPDRTGDDGHHWRRCLRVRLRSVLADYGNRRNAVNVRFPAQIRGGEMNFQKWFLGLVVLLLCTVTPVAAQISPSQELSAALFSGNLPKIQELLNRNPALMNSLQPGRVPTAPIHTLMSTPPNKKVLDLVFRYRFDVNQMLEGYTPLDAAVVSGNVEGVRYLFGAGAKTNLKGPDGGNSLHTALGRATFKKEGTVELVNTLLAGGVDPNARNSAGRPPLMIAVGLAAKDDALAASVVRALLKGGAQADPMIDIAGRKLPLSKMVGKTPPKTTAALQAGR